MDIEDSITVGGLLALIVFTAFFLLTTDFSISSNTEPVARMERASRFFYAGVMTVAPTSRLAVVIDMGALVVAGIGLVQGARKSIKMGIVVAAFVYFLTSFLVNFATAPV